MGRLLTILAIPGIGYVIKKMIDGADNQKIIISLIFTSVAIVALIFLSIIQEVTIIHYRENAEKKGIKVHPYRIWLIFIKIICAIFIMIMLLFFQIIALSLKTTSVFWTILTFDFVAILLFYANILSNIDWCIKQIDGIGMPVINYISTIIESFAKKLITNKLINNENCLNCNQQEPNKDITDDKAVGNDRGSEEAN